MSMNYDYGPNTDFSVRLVGTIKEYNGSYRDLDPQQKYLLQAVCHMIYQIKEDIRSSPSGILKLDGVWAHWIPMQDGDDYSLYTNDMMTVFHIIETGYHTFDFEFFSPNQFVKADSLIDYAYNHRLVNGRAR